MQGIHISIYEHVQSVGIKAITPRNILINLMLLKIILAWSDVFTSIYNPIPNNMHVNSSDIVQK